MNLTIGASSEVFTTVTPSMTAAVFALEAGEAYPAVLATPFMLAEMERAAAALLCPLLRSNEVSVGAIVDIAHLRPTPVGARLTSHARFTGRRGSLFCFEVWAEDASGIVGRGRHGRAIVDLKDIVAQAERGTKRRLEDQ